MSAITDTKRLGDWFSDSKCSVMAFVLTASLNFAINTFASSVIYSNIYDPATYDTHSYGFFSYESPIGSKEKADDFVLAHASRLDAVSWHGYMPGFDGVNSEFRVTIYESYYSVEYGAYLPTLEEAYSTIGLPVATDIDFQAGSVITNYDLQLPVGIVLEAGVYFLGVQAILEGGQGQPQVWSWNHGESPNSPSNVAVIRYGDVWTALDIPSRNHQMFELRGVVVPLPGAIWMLASALAFLAVGHYRARP